MSCARISRTITNKGNSAGLTLIVLLASTFLASAQVTEDMGQYVSIERLSQRVIVAHWLGMGRCNLTAIQSQKGLVMIDTEMSPRIMAPIKRKIEQAFGRKDWVYVINTHAHDNHAGGNSLFKGAVVIGHENLAEDMQWLFCKQSEADWKRKDLEFSTQTIRNLESYLAGISGNQPEVRRTQGEIRFWQLYHQDMEEGYPIIKPSQTYTDNRILDLGDLQLELVFFGKGHSMSDTLIYVPKEQLLVTGAIIYQHAHLPEIGEKTQLEDLNRFISVLDRFLGKDIKIKNVIPSHSVPLPQKDLVPVRDYYQRMLAGVRAAQKKGLTLEQASRQLAVPTCFPAFDLRILGRWAQGMQERNMKNLWRIVSDEQREQKIP